MKKIYLKQELAGGPLDEKGYGSIIGTAAIVLILLITLGIFAASLENSYDQISTVKAERNVQMVNKIQTDVEIDNVAYVSSENENLWVVLRNTGSTELDKLKTNLIVDGTLVPEENIKYRMVDGDIDTDIWLPEENMVIETENIKSIFGTSVDRVKVVTELGISDYMENIGG